MFDEYKVDLQGPCGSVAGFVVVDDAASRYIPSRAQKVEATSAWNLHIAHPRAIVMSDTPDEIKDHLAFIYRAHGICLINGLGLDMAATAALRKPNVAHVYVVEQSADVISLVAPTYKKNYSDRLTVLHGDALTDKWPELRGVRFDAVWHDIWDTICGDNLPEMTKLHRRYARRCNWQGSWARALCRRGCRR